MSRRHILTIAVISVLPFALSGCQDETQSDPRLEPQLVRTVTVNDAGRESRVFSGIVAARVESGLGFRVSGKVQERLVDTGQTVKRGQLLMRIDPVDLQLAAHAQQEAVVAAQARAEQASDDEARYRDLQGTGAISASTYDQIKAAADAAKAQLRAAKAQAQVALNATRYTDLYADVDGTVIGTLAEPGQVVNAGQVVIRVAHAGAREAVIDLPETIRPTVGTFGLAKLFGATDVTSQAKLRQLSDAADPMTRTFEARYVLTGEMVSAPLGSTVTIEIANDQTDSANALQVPIGALFDSGKGVGVWEVNGNPATVSWQAVTVVKLDEDTARITGQLKSGDQIVALGAHLLREGEMVKVLGQSSSVGTEGALK